MADTPTTRLLTDAVLAALNAVPNLVVGDGNPPVQDPPYAVLFPLDDSDRDGNARTIDDQSGHDFQISHVGTLRVQAQAMQDKTREAMRSAATATAINLAIAPDGRILRSQIQLDVGGGVFPDEEVPGDRLFMAIDTYEIWTTTL